ncbi:MAG: RluA family pseudouridine synthase [Candidatus Saccharimonadales bacterium]
MNTIYETYISNSNNVRLDSYIANIYKNVSRSFLQKLCKNNLIFVNNAPAAPGYKLKIDDVISFYFQMSTIEESIVEELPVIYEDNDIIVINKPVGIISHARGRYYNEASVASFVRSKVTDMDGERAGIVHRLDRATSGVMVCAKNPSALTWLQKEFANRKVIKTYVAVIEGHIKPKEAIVDMPIERNPKNPSTFKVGPNGKSSITHYFVKQQSSDNDLLVLTPKTGRTHQLRVHLKHLGHPIIGDTLYGKVHYRRLMLHAQSIEIELPIHIKKTFLAPLPKEFTEFLHEK